MSEQEGFSDDLDTLYRFRSLRGEFGRNTAEDIILHNRMHWSSPRDFNDPMDCAPHLIFGRSHADRIRWANNAAKRQRPDLARGGRRRLVRTILEDGPEAIAERHREGFRSFMAESAVCCFTKTAENLLLWAHYGDSHWGVCFVFDEVYDTSRVNIFVAHDVTYSSERPEVDVTSFGGNIEAFKNSVLTKAEDWQYEQEKRMFRYREPAGVTAFPSEAFKGVIFGARTPDNDRRFILDLLERRGGTYQIWQARLSSTEFRIEIEPYCDG